MKDNMCLLALLLLCVQYVVVSGQEHNMNVVDAQNSVLQGRLSQGKELHFQVYAPADGNVSANVLLTLSTKNEDGDADMFCLPSAVVKKSGSLPSSHFSIWKSVNSQGDDYIFVSRYHSMYPVVAYEGGDVRLTCTVSGFALVGSDFEVQLEIDYSDRLLVSSEEVALDKMFNKCCQRGAWEGAKCERKWREPNAQYAVHFCHSRRNICNSEGHLLQLDLKRYGLDCDFPTEVIQEFKYLRNLKMSMNNLRGDVHEILDMLQRSLKNISVVDLSVNNLHGNIGSQNGTEPAACLLTHGNHHLSALNLEFNFLKGELPSCLFDANSTLREIVLGGSNLSGELPTISPESEIQIIRLDKTGLRGAIPDTLGELESLAVLDLSDNLLKGPLPENIGAPRQLRTLRLEANQLEAAISESISLSESLRVVRLDINNFTRLPESYYTRDGAVSESLVVFNAARNSLQGTFPLALARAPNLKVLNLGENQLTGTLPDEEGMFPSVAVLILAANSFTGPIPESLSGAGMFNTQEDNTTPILDLGYNNLTGTIPSFMKQSDLELTPVDIRLEGNQLRLDCDDDLDDAVNGVLCSNYLSNFPEDSTPDSERG